MVMEDFDPKGIRAAVLDYFQTTLDNVMRMRRDMQEEIPCHVHFISLGQGESPELLQVHIVIMENIPKEILPTVVKTGAEKFDALYLVHVHEAWGLMGIPLAEADAWYAAGKTIEEHPNKVELLFARLEGPDIEETHYAKIVDGVVGDFESLSGGAKGNLVNMAGLLSEPLDVV